MDAKKITIIGDEDFNQGVNDFDFESIFPFPFQDNLGYRKWFASAFVRCILLFFCKKLRCVSRSHRGARRWDWRNWIGFTTALSWFPTPLDWIRILVACKRLTSRSPSIHGVVALLGSTIKIWRLMLIPFSRMFTPQGYFLSPVTATKIYSPELTVASLFWWKQEFLLYLYTRYKEKKKEGQLLEIDKTVLAV